MGLFIQRSALAWLQRAFFTQGSQFLYRADLKIFFSLQEDTRFNDLHFLSLCWHFPLASISKQHAALLIDLFGWYVLFSRWRSGGISPFVFFIIMLACARERDEIGRKQSSKLLSHYLHWENKTYKLKGCINFCTRNIIFHFKLPNRFRWIILKQGIFWGKNYYITDYIRSTLWWTSLGGRKPVRNSRGRRMGMLLVSRGLNYVFSRPPYGELLASECPLRELWL